MAACSHKKPLVFGLLMLDLAQTAVDIVVTCGVVWDHKVAAVRCWVALCDDIWGMREKVSSEIKSCNERVFFTLGIILWTNIIGNCLLIINQACDFKQYINCHQDLHGEILQDPKLLSSQMASSSLACFQPDGVFLYSKASADIWDNLSYFKWIWNCHFLWPLLNTSCFTLFLGQLYAAWLLRDTEFCW